MRYFVENMVVWFTGLSSAGKTTIAEGVEQHLRRRGMHVQVLDGDQMRRNLCRDLGFSEEDRIDKLADDAGLVHRLHAADLPHFELP